MNVANLHSRLKAASDLSTRIEGMDALPVLKMSVALDPRYKKLKCLPREQRDAVWEISKKDHQVFKVVLEVMTILNQRLRKRK